MVQVERVKSLADLQEADRVEPRELIETLRDYAKTGAGISHRMFANIIENNNFRAGDLAEVLDSCVRGVIDQLRRNFPHDAANWARVAHDIARDVSEAGTEKAPTQAASLDMLNQAINEAGLTAIRQHRSTDTAQTSNQALETGHLMILVRDKLYPPNPLATATLPHGFS